MNAKDIGQRGEDAAAAYLLRCGMRIVDRNWRCSAGEIDIIALDADELVFVEVKTRRVTSAGTPEEAVSPSKQKRLARLARTYLAQTGLTETHVRFDVIAIQVVTQDRALLRHRREAFSTS